MSAVHTNPDVESISIKLLYDNFKTKLQLRLVAGSSGLNKIIREKSINRPSLALTGFLKYFGEKRLQLFGAGEMAYLKTLSSERQLEVLTSIAKLGIPCIIVARNISPTKAMYTIAETYKIPLLRTHLPSKDFSAEATLLLEPYFAPRTYMHGTLMDVKGIGTLLRGSSGAGKSECALALIQQGYSLVADDLTYIRLVGQRELIGTSSELSRGYMECRGIGIINITSLFGVRALRLEKRIDLVVNFLEFRPGLDEERTGLDQTFMKILDIDIPVVEIPVRPGRDLARLVEVAAMVQALRLLGHNDAQQFNEQLIKHMS